jgi:spermidine/putrescine transport system permease protein
VGNNLTLPVYIFSQLRFGISPKVNVIAVLITLFTLFVIAVLLLSRRLYGKILMRIGR